MYSISEIIIANLVAGVLTVIIGIVTIPIEYKMIGYQYRNIWLPIKRMFRKYILRKYYYNNKFHTGYISKSNIKEYQ